MSVTQILVFLEGKDLEIVNKAAKIENRSRKNFIETAALERANDVIHNVEVLGYGKQK